MSSNQFNSGKAHGEGQAKADQWMESAKSTAQSAKDAMHSAANSDSMQTARENKEQAAGFLQQTGEQVKEMASHAADAVKNAVGMGSNNNNNHGSGATTTITKH